MESVYETKMTLARLNQIWEKIANDGANRGHMLKWELPVVKGQYLQNIKHVFGGNNPGEFF